MDLERLRIPASARPSGNRYGPAGWLIAALLIVAGFFLGRCTGPRGAAGAVPVETLTVQAAGNEAATRFTAGGWIEVATPDQPIVVSARVGETLEKLHVREGDRVEPGSLLAELYAVDLVSARTAAQAREQRARAEYDRLRAGYRAEERAAAAARLAALEEEVDRAEAVLARSRRLPAGAVAAEQLEAEAAAAAAAAARASEARAERDRLEAGYRVEEIAAAKAQWAEAQAAREEAERDVAYARLCSPVEGPALRVLKVHRSPGQWVEPGPQAAVVSLYDPARLQARIDVDQARIGGVAIGTPVRIATEADRERTYRGRVIRLDPLAELSKNTLSVRVAIEDPDELLFPEMTARITFLAEEPDTGAGRLVVIPQTAVVREDGEAWVFVVRRGMAERRDVRLGGERPDGVEVLEGLHLGERVIRDAASVQEGTRVRTTS